MNKFFFLLCFFLVALALPGRAFSLAEKESAVSKEVKQFLEKLEKEELQVQDTFPQYKAHFNHKKVQEEVYKEFLQKLKEKPSSD